MFPVVKIIEQYFNIASFCLKEYQTKAENMTKTDKISVMYWVGQKVHSDFP